MNKILIITPTPTHPTNAGNRAAIVALVRELKEAGKEVHCMYIPFEDYSHAEMTEFFEGRLYTFERDYLIGTNPRFIYYRKRIVQKLNSLQHFMIAKLGIKKNDFDLYNKKIDEVLSYQIKKFTRKIARENKFDAIICEYVWFSGLLKYFSAKTFKIIDTHDRFSNRYLIYRKLDRTPEWNSLFPAEEAKGLKRADLILALNVEEKEYFEKISGKKTIVRLPVIRHTVIQKSIFRNTLLYFASDNIINLTSIRRFIDEILPLVNSEAPEVKLLIGGSICTKLHHLPPHVQLSGSFLNPADFYILGDVVINPEIDGTGFKIKTFEAMSYGLPVVSTRAGAAGLNNINGEHLVIAEDNREFANGILSLIKNSDLREKMASKAGEWAQLTRKETSNNLMLYLDSVNRQPV